MPVPAFLNMIGPTELIIILVIVLIVFGAGRLPQVLGQLGSGVKAFRDAQKDDAIDVTSRPKELPKDELGSVAEEVQEKESSKRNVG